MLRTITNKPLPLYIRSLALVFTAVVLVLLGLLMPTDAATAAG